MVQGVKVSLLGVVGFAAFGLVACASSTPPPDVAPQSDGADNTHTPRGDEAHHTTAATFHLPADPRDPQRLLLDSPCSATATAGTPEATYCGTKGRISVEYGNHPLVGDAPCRLRSLSHGQSGDAAQACVMGDEIVATDACMMCRIPDQGFATHARISEMTADQSKQLFTQLGLAGDVPTTAKGWEIAIANGQPAPQPSGAYNY